MPHVFISYDQDSDGDFVAAVQLELQRAGFTSWTDREIEGGHAWQEKVDNAIRDSLALIAVLSQGSLQSAYVAYEWAFALGAGVRVIPIRRGIELSELHERLRVLDVLDFSSGRLRPWAELFEALGSAAQEAQDPGRAFRTRVSDAVRTAARALDSVHEPEREAAIDSLEQMTDPGAQEALANALGHPVKAVRYRAACLLGKKGDARAIDVLVNMLVDPGPKDLTHIRMAFWNLGADALPRLDALCEHNNHYVREFAILALGTIDPAYAAERLLAASHDPDADVRSSAVHGLANLKNNPRAMAAVLERVEDEHRDVRCAAAIALGKLGADDAVNHLALLAQDTDWNTRRFAIEALGAVRSTAGIEALVAAAETDDTNTRRLCAESLGRTGRPEALPVLVEMLRDDDCSVIEHAWSALGKLHIPQATEALLSLLENADASVRKRAARTLGESGDLNAAEGLLAALQTAAELDLIRDCCDALKNLRAKTAVPALVALLAHEDKNVARCAHDALYAIGTPEARQALTAARKLSL
jgi:HEAT repeat protein